MTVGGGGSCPNPSTDSGTPGGNGTPSTAAFGSTYEAGGGGGGSVRDGSNGGAESGLPIGGAGVGAGYDNTGAWAEGNANPYNPPGGGRGGSEGGGAGAGVSHLVDPPN